MKRARVETISDSDVNCGDEVKRCKHFVIRKKRFCKMTVAKGKEYCGEHCPTQNNNQSSENENSSIDSNDRIPCPLDPKHTVYRKNLKKHLRICNAKPKNYPKYIVPGINIGGDDGTNSANDISNVEQGNIKLSEVDEGFLNALIAKIENIYENHVKDKIDTLKLQHEILKDELNNEQYGQETRKHLLQTSSILGYLQYFDTFQENTSFIEFGAGKGHVSFWLAQAIANKNNSQVILIDKASHRHKKDNKIEDRNIVYRIRADIADFDIRKLDLLDASTNGIIAVSKHLCGAATDFTLRCILLRNQQQQKPFDDTNVMLPQIKFFLIALCCHHRCDWKSFVGKSFFHQNNLTENDFVLIKKMVGWAVCGTGYSRERQKEIEENQNSDQVSSGRNDKLTRERKEQLGVMCKRILDCARLKYMEENGFKCQLKYYVDSSVTLENVCLIGTLSK